MSLYEYTDRYGDALYVSRTDDRLFLRSVAVTLNEVNEVCVELDTTAVDRLIDTLQWWRGHRPQDCPADPAQRLTTLTVADVRGIVSEFLPAILPGLVAEYLERPAADNYPTMKCGCGHEYADHVQHTHGGAAECVGTPRCTCTRYRAEKQVQNDACIEAPECVNCGHGYTDHRPGVHSGACTRYRAAR